MSREFPLRWCIPMALATMAVGSQPNPSFVFEPMKSSGSFVAHGIGYTVRLDPTGHTLRWIDAARRETVLETRLVGANPGTKLVGTDPQQARANYLKGPDPREWRLGVATFGRVRYEEVYPGIDLVFHGSTGKVEYDFVVAPGADAEQIAMEIRGADRLTVDGSGDLLLAADGGQARWKRPEIHQASASGKRLIDGHFVVSGNRVRFELGDYDHRRELVIDPSLVYATYFGSRGNEAARSIALDNSGNVYVAGFTTSDGLAKTAGTVQPAYGGDNPSSGDTGDAFVAKYSPQGGLVYVTYLGGRADDIALGLALDSQNNIYVTGYTNSNNFPVSSSAFQRTFAGFTAGTFHPGGDAFVAKLNNAATTIAYCTLIGGRGDDRGIGIAVDAQGNAYVAGNTVSMDFPVTTGVVQSTYGGGVATDIFAGGDAFVAKLNPAGSALVYSTFLGGNRQDAAGAIAVDAQGSAFVAGATASANFPVTSGAFQRTFGGQATEALQPIFTLGDAFVAKLNPAATGLVYSTFLGGKLDESAMGIALDSTGAAYVAGVTSSTDFPVTTGAAQTSYKGPTALASGRYFTYGDAFVTKLNPAGGQLVYSTLFGGAQDDGAWGIALDSGGSAWIAGTTNSTDLPMSADAMQRTFGGSGGQTLATGDGFLAKLNPAGTSFVYSSYLGGNQDDGVGGIAIDAAGAVYVTGSTMSTNFPVGTDAETKTFQGRSSVGLIAGDSFLVKVSDTVVVAPTPASLSAVGSIAGLTGAVETALAAPIVVEVRDGGRAVLAGVTVAFAATNARVDPASAVTDRAGQASVRVTLGATVGAATVTATVAGLPPLVIPIQVTAAPRLPTLVSVANEASLVGGPVAPGQRLLLKGGDMGPDEAVGTPFNADGSIATLAAEAKVTFDGVAAALISVQAGTIKVIAPYSLVPGTKVQAQVEYKGNKSNQVALQVVDASPGVYAGADGTGQAQATNEDGSVNSAEAGAAVGSVITFTATGEGQTTPPGVDGVLSGDPGAVPVQPVQVTIDGKAAEMVYYGAVPGQAGMLLVRVRIPDGTPTGQAELVLTVGPSTSQANVTVAVQ